MISVNQDNISKIEPFRSIKDKNLLPQGLAIVESEKVVLKALNSKFEVISTIVTQDFYDRNQNILNTKSNEVFLVDKKIMEGIVGYNLHHGIMSLVRLPEYKSVDQLGDRILIFNGVMSAENVGTMTRAALAFGFNSIIFDYKSASPYLRRCIRVSMGNVFEVDIHKSNYLPRTINELQDLGYTVIATANEEGAQNLLEFNYPEKTCIVIGNEGNGMDREVIDACDIKLFIPISNYVAHLNAASAASIFLFHAGNF